MSTTKPEPRPHASFEELAERISAHKARVAIVGLGYVGLPVAVGFAETGFEVIGLDIDPDRVAAIQAGTSYVSDVSNDRLGAVRESDRFQATTDASSLGGADVILISVPTPIREGVPDLSLVLAAGQSLRAVLTPGSLVVLESTTYPGTTEELLLPTLEEGGMKGGTDFWLAFSPERIDPGNPVYEFEDIPKIVGGIDESSTELSKLLYEQVTPRVFTVSGTREAELAKLIENTFRHVNIALINELAVYARELGIDIWESIEAAATKPFGFMPFWPSPGWGGHCIPLDPAYLSWRVRKDRAHEVRFVELAQAVNSEMPRYVAERMSLLLNEQGKAVKGTRICGVGVAYKAGIDDTRESAALRVLNILKSRGAEISFHDPLVDETSLQGEVMTSSEATEAFWSSQDLVIVFIPQTMVDWESIGLNAQLVFDCCNILPRGNPKIVRL